MTVKQIWQRIDNTIYQLTHDGYSKGVETFRNRFWFLVNFDKEVTKTEQDHILTAIELAGDNALVAKAYTQFGARWEPFVHSKTEGEFCIFGIRYFTRLNIFGIPCLNDSLRQAILYYDKV